jgi:tetratricopeptide (TPR) repeat protein
MMRAAVPTARALTVLLAALAAAPAARAQSPTSLWRRVVEPSAREAAAAARAGEWLQFVDALPEFWRARLSPERDDVSHDALRRDALARLDRSLALRPDDARTLAAAAQLRERGNDLDGAARDAERALALDPEGVAAHDAHFTLAVVRTWRGEHASARDHYLALLRLPLGEQSRAIALGNLADTFMALGDVPAAVTSYEAAVALRPDYALGWLGLAVARDRALVDPRGDAAAAVRAASDEALGGRRGPDFVPEAILAALAAEGVFYVPPRDEIYYRATAHEAVARALSPGNPFGAPPDAVRAAQHRADAAEAWRRYLAAAPADDAWRARAEGHLRALGGRAR